MTCLLLGGKLRRRNDAKSRAWGINPKPVRLAPSRRVVVPMLVDEIFSLFLMLCAWCYVPDVFFELLDGKGRRLADAKSRAWSRNP